MPDSQIRSTVADGWVTLEGDVGAWYERDAAECAVRHLAGVRGVVNAIDVDLPYVKIEAIRDEIELALERRAIREAVLGAARYTHGVRDVEDHLHSVGFEQSPRRSKRGSRPSESEGGHAGLY